MTRSTDWDIMKSTYSDEEPPKTVEEATRRVLESVLFEYLDEDFMMFTESTNYPSWNESQQKRYLRGVEKVRKMIQSGSFTVNKIQKSEMPVKSEPTFNKVKTLREYMMPHVD